MTDAPARPPETAAPSRPDLGVPMAEFVAIIAFLMALTALSVDIMLVVLPDIASQFTLMEANHQQFMITVYMGAFAFGHIFAGPLSDRFGRKVVLIGGLGVYVIGSGIAVVADSYAMLLASRAIQGFGAAGPRVVAVAVVRDRFVGREMSQVMSFVMTVFIMLPMLAPAIGAGIAMFGSWAHIFLFLFVYGCGLALWVVVRLPETNPVRGPSRRAPVTLADAVLTILENRQTIGYMLAIGFIFGCLLTYIATSQQMFADIYGVVTWFPAVFAIVSGGMIVSTVVNARIVKRLGMRPISHGAVLAMIVLSTLAFVAEEIFGDFQLWILLTYLTVCFFLIGLILPNFNALAMEPLGRIAGTGSSFVGFVMTGGGALLGGFAGHFYDGTTRSVMLAFLVYSLACAAIVLVTERGRLMHASARGAIS